jgi:hypothetical protein
MFAGELPWQIVWFAEAVPPTEVGLTVTVTVLFAATEFVQSKGEVPLPRSVTVIVDVADKVFVINVPDDPLNTIVAIFPELPGLVVL